MNCSNCGSQLFENMTFCTACGAPVQNIQQGHQNVVGNGLMLGYSNVIHSSEMKKFIEKRKKGMKIIILVLLAGLWIGFPGFALFSDEMEFTEGLVIAGFITLVFGVINIYSKLKNRKSNKEWEGDIVNKQLEQRIRKVRNDDDDVEKVKVQEYILYVKPLDHGKVREINLHQNMDLFNYYNVGDRIKHHVDTFYYEKYDKTRDPVVVCVQCGRLNQLHSDRCTKCKMPILK